MSSDKIYHGFFSGTFGAGTFDFDWNDAYQTKKALMEDYRVKYLFNNRVNDIYVDKGDILLKDLNVIFTGPYWKEEMENGEETINDCFTLCHKEMDRIDRSDFVVCVLTNNPSVGSTSEIMYAMMSGKPTAIFYQVDKKFEPLTIPARHWWVISAGIKLMERTNISHLAYPFENIDEIKEKLQNKDFYVMLNGGK